MLILTGEKESTFLKRTRLIARSLKLEYKEVPEEGPEDSEEVKELNGIIDQMVTENNELKDQIAKLQEETKGAVANITGKPNRNTKQDKEADNLNTK